MKIRTNFIPTDLNRGGFASPVFTPDSKPDYNSAIYPTFKGALAEKNFADLIQNDEIRNKDASYIIGSRLFDAVVDANGGSDFTSIQDALDAGKTRIFVRAGTYLIKDTIRIESDNVSIIGETFYKTVIQLETGVSTDTNIMSIDATSSGNTLGCFFQNLRFFGDEPNQVNVCGKIYINEPRYCVFDRCVFQEINDDPLYIDSPSDILIQNCYFFSNIGYSKIENGSIARIINNLFSETGNGIYAFSSGAGSSPNLFVNGNHFISVTDAIKVEGLSREIIINNNIFSGADYAVNIYQSGGNSPERISICNNSFTNSYNDCITLDGVNNVLVNSNVIDDFAVDATYAIILKNTSTYNIISGNSITNCPEYGIRENAVGDDYNIITNNIVQGAANANISIQGANSIQDNNI